jgi:adenylate cyclase
MNAPVQPGQAGDPVEYLRRQRLQDAPEAKLQLVPQPGRVAAASPARLAVIVAADVLEYSRHMADDEAGTHARFSAICDDLVKPGVEFHEGSVFKHTGDGFMAIFWSAALAVSFALEFQAAVKHRNGRRARARCLEFRVGINLGDVIVEPDDVFGHNVNVAARLQAMAKPGSVLVSQSVAAAVRDPRLRFEDAGSLQLKNMKEVVRSYRAQLGGRVRGS